MTSFLNKTVSVRGERGQVIGQTNGKKPKLTIRFVDGHEETMGYGLVKVHEICGPDVFQIGPADWSGPTLTAEQAFARKMRRVSR